MAEPDTKSRRPTSPHLWIYRWTITMATSIIHRLTGLALGLGALLLTWWLLAAASGPDAFAVVHLFVTSWVGRLVLFGFTWALSFHLLNGIRHLAWDTGWGFELKTATATGWTVVILSVLITLLAWVIGYHMLGAY
jgi:succinate dehydrogenase / fumarate reductase cytochrome b subunit